MKLYIVIWQDRHSDTTTHPFRDLSEAITWARKQAKEYCRYPEDYKEKDIGDWLFYVEYSCESDCLWITEHEI